MEPIINVYCPHKDIASSSYSPSRDISGSEPVLVLDGELASRLFLVLIADEVRDLLVLRLLDGTLIALVSLSKDVLLDEVHTCTRDPQALVALEHRQIGRLSSN